MPGCHMLSSCCSLPGAAAWQGLTSLSQADGGRHDMLFAVMLGTCAGSLNKLPGTTPHTADAGRDSGRLV